MRLVFDTNAMVSGLLWPEGVAADVLRCRRDSRCGRHKPAAIGYAKRASNMRLKRMGMVRYVLRKVLACTHARCDRVQCGRSDHWFFCLIKALREGRGALARPIEPTPVLSGDDARRIRAELQAARDPQRDERGSDAAAWYRVARTGRPVTISVKSPEKL